MTSSAAVSSNSVPFEEGARGDGPAEVGDSKSPGDLGGCGRRWPAESLLSRLEIGLQRWQRLEGQTHVERRLDFAGEAVSVLLWVKEDIRPVSGGGKCEIVGDLTAAAI